MFRGSESPSGTPPSCVSLLQALKMEQGERGFAGPRHRRGYPQQLEKDELYVEQLSEVVSREQEDKSFRKSGTESELTLRVGGSRIKPRRISFKRVGVRQA